MHGDPVFGFEHRLLGFYRAGFYTGGVSAVITEDRDSRKFYLRETPFGFINKICPVKGLPFDPVRGIVLRFTGDSARTAPHTFLQINDHTIFSHDSTLLYISYNLSIFTPVKPPFRAVLPVRRS